MASLAPIDRPVPNKPWRARRKRDGMEHFLGYFPTREEAEAAERRFDADWPPYRTQKRN